MRVQGLKGLDGLAECPHGRLDLLLGTTILKGLGVLRIRVVRVQGLNGLDGLAECPHGRLDLLLGTTILKGLGGLKD